MLFEVLRFVYVCDYWKFKNVIFLDIEIFMVIEIVGCLINNCIN